jgi:hypothetical protein
MTIKQAKEDVIRRVKDARNYAATIHQKRLADVLQRVADEAEASLPALNKEGLLVTIGKLHGVTYAAATYMGDQHRIAKR